MIKTGFLNAQKLPLVVEPESQIKAAASCNLLDFVLGDRRDFLQKNLLAHGAILFRGFRINNVQSFENLVRKFSGAPFFNYSGGVSPRISLGKGAYTSTEYPPHLNLALHNELSYSEKFPKHLYFCCLNKAETGGETTLGDSRRILNKIRPKIVGLFKHKKIRYERNLSGEKGSGYSWQDAFECEDKSKVEEFCRKINADFEWKNNGTLRLSQTRPATTFHQETNEETWFNQADGFHPSNLDEETYKSQISESGEESFRLNSSFGDGSRICDLMLEHVRQVLKKETVYLNWQNGDFLILDNILASHGRNAFSGKRKIALAMT